MNSDSGSCRARSGDLLRVGEPGPAVELLPAVVQRERDGGAPAAGSRAANTGDPTSTGPTAPCPPTSPEAPRTDDRAPVAYGLRSAGAVHRTRPEGGELSRDAPRKSMTNHIIAQQLLSAAWRELNQAAADLVLVLPLRTTQRSPQISVSSPTRLREKSKLWPLQLNAGMTEPRTRNKHRAVP